MSKKRLLITATTFPRWEGDNEPRFILDLAKSLLEYADVTVLTPSSPGAEDKEVIEGVKVERFHYLPFHDNETLTAPGAMVSRIKQKKVRGALLPFFYKSFVRELKKRKDSYDMVQANWVIPQGVIAEAALKNDVPYVVTCHGSDVNTMNNAFFTRLKRKALKGAWGVTTVSNDLMKSVNQIYRNHNQAVISMGVDINEFNPKNSVDNFFNQNGKKTIVFVGRLVDVKGVKYLIESMRGIKNTKLVIVGNGELKEELKKQARSLKSELEKDNSEISFTGAKTHNELKTVYASADLFVMPGITTSSGAKEGFGLVLLEAFASGLPVVASRTGGIPSIVTDGENGLLVEEKNVEQLRDAIIRVLGDDELRKTLSLGALSKAKEYDYSVIGRKYAEFMKLI